MYTSTLWVGCDTVTVLTWPGYDNKVPVTFTPHCCAQGKADVMVEATDSTAGSFSVTVPENVINHLPFEREEAEYPRLDVIGTIVRDGCRSSVSWP